MLVMRASSDCRWLSALVTFCALSGSSQRSCASASVFSRAISASSFSTAMTALMSSKVFRSVAIWSERSSSIMAGSSLPAAGEAGREPVRAGRTP